MIYAESFFDKFVKITDFNLEIIYVITDYDHEYFKQNSTEIKFFQKLLFDLKSYLVIFCNQLSKNYMI